MGRYCCEDCNHYYSGGIFCGYESHECELHGNLDGFDHPTPATCSDFKMYSWMEEVVKNREKLLKKQKMY